MDSEKDKAKLITKLFDDLIKDVAKIYVTIDKTDFARLEKYYDQLKSKEPWKDYKTTLYECETNSDLKSFIVIEDLMIKILIKMFEFSFPKALVYWINFANELNLEVGYRYVRVTKRFEIANKSYNKNLKTASPRKGKQLENINNFGFKSKIFRNQCIKEWKENDKKYAPWKAKVEFFLYLLFYAFIVYLLFFKILPYFGI